MGQGRRLPSRLLSRRPQRQQQKHQTTPTMKRTRTRLADRRPAKRLTPSCHHSLGTPQKRRREESKRRDQHTVVRSAGTKRGTGTARAPAQLPTAHRRLLLLCPRDRRGVRRGRRPRARDHARPDSRTRPRWIASSQSRLRRPAPACLLPKAKGKAPSSRRPNLQPPFTSACCAREGRSDLQGTLRAKGGRVRIRPVLFAPALEGVRGRGLAFRAVLA